MVCRKMDETGDRVEQGQTNSKSQLSHVLAYMQKLHLKIVSNDMLQKGNCLEWGQQEGRGESRV
jgi:hypothetical protein